MEAGEWSVNQQLVDDMVDCQPSGKETNNGKGMGAGQPTLVWLRWFLRISWDFVNVDIGEPHVKQYCSIHQVDWF